MKQILIGIITLLSCSSCDPDGAFEIRYFDTQSVKIINRTKNGIIIDNALTDVDYATDRQHVYDVFKFFPAGTTTIAPDSVYRYMRVVMDGRERERRYHVLVLKEGTMERYTPEELIEGNIYDKWYVLTLDELEAADFTITYTGE